MGSAPLARRAIATRRRAERRDAPLGERSATSACHLAGYVLRALLLLIMMPNSAPAADAPDEELPPPPEPPAEDLIPPLPKRPKPARQPSTNWTQWNDVERYRGYYECRRTSGRTYGNPADTVHLELVATATFELQPAEYQGRTSKAWAAGTGDVVGSYHEAGSRPDWTYTVAGVFDGPASDFMFGGVNTRGEWQFHTGGKLLQPYTRNLDGVLQTRDNDSRKREEHRVESRPSDTYPHAGFRGVAPAGRPGPIRGVWDYSHGSLKDNKENHHARVMLVPEYKDVELVVEIEGTMPGVGTVPYEKWIPRGTPSGAAGSRLKVSARLQAPDGGPVKATVDNFSFVLNDTSREPGVCLNYPRLAAPAAEAPADPDLKFAPGGETDAERQQLDMASSIDDPVHPHAETRIDCFDFGAWSDLTVTAELTDGRIITGHLKGDRAAIVMPLPKRSGGSYIADAWKAEHGVAAGDMDDAEKLPSAGKSPGDGFTLYEEYRGFVENGKHLEGDPKKIDFFVRNYVGGDARPGIELFGDLTGAEVHHRLRGAEFDPKERVMNANHQRGPHHVDQHGVFIRTEAGRDGAGAVFSRAGVRGRPVLCTGIYIRPREVETAVTTSENLPASELIFTYDRAIVHELLHAVGVEHHGHGDYHSGFQLVFADDPRNKTGQPLFWIGSSEKVVTITDEATGRDLAAILAPDLLLAREIERERFFDQFEAKTRKQIADRRGTITTAFTEDQIVDLLYNDIFGNFYWYVGAEHGECSGDDGCATRYYFAKLYEKKGVAYAYYYIGKKETERAGLGLCVSRVGTGVNAPGRKPQARYGDTLSGWGECADWIVFNDAVPPEPEPTK